MQRQSDSLFLVTALQKSCVAVAMASISKSSLRAFSSVRSSLAAAPPMPELRPALPRMRWESMPYSNPTPGSGAHSYVVTASAPASETALSNEARASDGTQLQTQFVFDENSSTTPQKPRNRRAPDSAGHPYSARDLRGTRFSLAITAILAHCDRSATRTEVSR